MELSFIEQANETLYFLLRVYRPEEIEFLSSYALGDISSQRCGFLEFLRCGNFAVVDVGGRESGCRIGNSIFWYVLLADKGILVGRVSSSSEFLFTLDVYSVILQT
jgi:hypothetical protein